MIAKVHMSYVDKRYIIMFVLGRFFHASQTVFDNLQLKTTFARFTKGG